MTAPAGADAERVTGAALRADGGMIAPPPGLLRGDLRDVRASLLIVPRGALADRILERPLDRDLLVVDPAGTPRAPRSPAAGTRTVRRSATGCASGTATLTIYLGSVAGSGKTYTMLDRAHQLIADGVDVVAALVETHGRVDTAAQLAGLECRAPPQRRVDRDALRCGARSGADRRARAHQLSPGARAKRFDDVIAVLRRGIDVITTLNVQHLEGLGDAVERLTGTRVRETLPDTVLEFADEVLFVDVTPDLLRQRLREGKIYPRERIDTALSNFFRTENLAALRELAVREVLRARSERRRERPFARIVLGVAPGARDEELVERAGRLARRLDVDLRVVAIEPQDDVALDPAARIVQLLAPGDALVVAAPRHPKRRFFAKPSFAARVLAAGARELLVLAPGAARPAWRSRPRKEKLAPKPTALYLPVAVVGDVANDASSCTRAPTSR